MKLAITQMVLGALIAEAAFISSRWGFPTEFTVLAPEPAAEGAETFITVMANPGTMQVVAQVCAFLAFGLGLAVLGCGIAQFLKARRS